MKFCWSEREELALHGLPHFTQIVYLRGIKFLVDEDTGIVRINFKDIRNAVKVKPVPGVVVERLATNRMIRVALKQLTHVGLIEPVGDPKALEFACKLSYEFMHRDAVPWLLERLSW